MVVSSLAMTSIEQNKDVECSLQEVLIDPTEIEKIEIEIDILINILNCKTEYRKKNSIKTKESYEPYEKIKR